LSSLLLYSKSSILGQQSILACKSTRIFLGLGTHQK
jgi:hypothetical protein